jgi:chitin disaccharide deacetylase
MPRPRSIRPHAPRRNEAVQRDVFECAQVQPVIAAMRAHNPAVAASGSRRIWLCADDYGLSLSVNTAIRDLVTRGRLNATSVMVAAPSFSPLEAMALSALNVTARRVAIGLHVTLTAPFRPMSSLFKRSGQASFLPLSKTFLHGILRRFEHEALTAEISAQMQAFRDNFGRTPDFVDGHHHVHLFPQIGAAVLEVVKATAPTAWVRQCGRTTPLRTRLADRKGSFLDLMSWQFRRRAQACGLSTNPAFAGTYDFADNTDFAAVFPRFLEGLPDGALVMCHPGFVDAELRRLDPLTTLREQEYAYFAGDTFPEVLAGERMALA